MLVASAGLGQAGEFRIAAAPDALERALRLAREHRLQAPMDRIVIDWPPGVFRRRLPIEIGPADSGLPGAPLIVRGASNGATIVSGAVVVAGRPAGQAEADRLIPLESLPKARVADSAEIGLVRPMNLVRRGAYAQVRSSALELFQGDRRLRPARWPKRNDVDVQTLDFDPKTGTARIHVPSQEFLRLGAERHLWLGGYPAYDWAFETVPVIADDAAARALRIETLAAPFPPRATFPGFVFNAFAALRDPGDYVVDPDRGDVTYLPFADKSPVEAAVAETVLRIRDAHDVVIEAMDFEKTLGSIVTVEDSRRVVFKNCFFGHSGGDGVAVTGGADVRIARSVVHDVSERGIVLAGGDRPSLTRAGHSVTDTIVDTFAVDSRTYKPGVDIYGVGITVEGSLIADGPHVGIKIWGNGNVIRGNELLRLIEETDDAGAIYMGRDWTQHGNVVEGNFLHDLGGRDAARRKALSGIYLDDQFSGTRIARNVIVGTDHGIFIGGGRDNKVESNLLIDQRKAGVWIDNRGMTWQKSSIDPSSPLMTSLHAMNVGSAVWRSSYPTLATLAADQPGVPKGNDLEGNIAFGAPVARYENAETKTLVAEKGSMQEPFSVDTRAAAIRSLLARLPYPLSGIPLADRRTALATLPFAHRAGTALAP